MTSKNVWFGRFVLSVIVALGLAVSGCGNDGTAGNDGADGMDGQDGQDGQDGEDGQDGKPGGSVPGPGDVVDLGDPLNEELLVAFGEPLVAEITGVTVASPPVIAFTLQTAGGADVIGLAPESVGATFVKLENGVWVSYVNVIEVPRDPAATPPSPDLLDGALQAGTDNGGMLVDNGDGTYQYTFVTDVASVTTPVPVTYNATLTHRAGIELRIDDDDVLNPDNPTFTFVPDGSPVTETRDIVDTATCNNCHGRLSLHGAGRFTTDYCVTCHNASSNQTGTRDQDYAELLDMAHMVHSIHASDLREELQVCSGGLNDGEACVGDAGCPDGTCIDYSYKVLGFGENFGGGRPFDFSETTYPQGLDSPLELLGCENCHKQSEATPDGDAWQTSSSATACGGCHIEGLRAVDSAGDPCENLYDAACVDDTTGLSIYAFQHPQPFGVLAADGSCGDSNCHGVGGARPIAEVHRNLLLEEAAKYAYRIDSVVLEGDGDIQITFAVSNPTDDTTYDITTDPAFTDSGATLRFRVAWSTDDYSNHQSGENVGQPFTIDALDECQGVALNCSANLVCNGGANDGMVCDPDADPTECPAGTCILDSFTLNDAIALPSTITGDSYGVAMEGHPRVDVDMNGSTNSIPVTSQIAYVSIDEPLSPTPRRDIVDIALCNNCHGMVSLHGDNRANNVQVCATCHNPNATDIEDRGEFCVGGTDDGSGCDSTEPLDCPGGTCALFTGEATVDFKVMIHQIHAANTIVTGRSVHDYTKVTYPRHLRLTNECNACHLEGTYYPVDVTESFRLATTTDSDLDLADPEDDQNTTFNAATCGGCHLDFMEPDAVTAAHMVQNGSSFLVEQFVDGELDPRTVETCVVCHGPDKSEDVGVVHGGHGGE